MSAEQSKGLHTAYIAHSPFDEVLGLVAEHGANRELASLGVAGSLDVGRRGRGKVLGQSAVKVPLGVPATVVVVLVALVLLLLMLLFLVLVVLWSNG